MLKGTKPRALKDGGKTVKIEYILDFIFYNNKNLPIGMSLVVLMLTVDTLVPALEPI